MSETRSIDPAAVHKIYAGSGELSPFHHCYATDEVVLRIAAGRFYAHDNGEDHTAAYWNLRQKVVIYDVPERPVEISGPDVVAFLETIFARTISDLKTGRGRYAIACTHRGGIFMDGILFKIRDDRYWYVQPDGALDTWLLAHSAGFDITVTDPQSRVLQIQGPESFKVMQAASEGAIDSSMGYFHSGFFDIGGQEVYISRTGWTGELGFEVYTQGNRTDCPRLWNHLMEAGAPYGLSFSSLKSMNTRRIEAGILDNGSDFDTSMTPYETGLSKFIDIQKQGFIGKEALLSASTDKRLFGLLCPKGTLRGGLGIFEGDNRVGYTTTGAYSPYLESGIGYVRFNNAGDRIGQKLIVHLPNKEVVDCEVVELPFYDTEKAIPRGLEVRKWSE